MSETGLLIGGFAALGALHLYWAAGGRWGTRVSVPSVAGRPLFTPGPAACVVVAALLLAAAGVVWLRWRFGIGALALIFAARAIGEFRYVGFFKRVRTTDFAWWDTHLFSPLCLVISVLAARQL